jgi:hypothetical protein
MPGFSNLYLYIMLEKAGRVGAELLHADGQTNITKLIVAFRNSAKARESRHSP